MNLSKAQIKEIADLHQIKSRAEAEGDDQMAEFLHNKILALVKVFKIKAAA